jgi:hypothetical protein
MRKRRWDILVELLKNRKHSVGAEIGVFEGDTTERLLRHLPKLKKFIWVDPFKHYPEHTATLRPKKPKFHDANFRKVERAFMNRVEIYKRNIEVVGFKMFSYDAAEKIEDETLDFVFIDANHAYEYISGDIAAWFPKVKIGGIISGHDYNVKRKRFGVNRAVKTAFGENYQFYKHVWWHERKQGEVLP